ncbi:hypothetical protein PLCT2_01823 [Planctomycetaceae bacterium]|nr:hypothetical protein PLCT2_01823 [Planctomycetaceae bacterium]
MNDARKHDDTTIRRYIQGRMDKDETAGFEQKVVRDKVTQARLDALRNQSLRLRELFTFAPFDLSSVQVNVRKRNPHRALGIPPAAALILQAVGLVAMFVLFHAMGAYIAPPDVRLERPEGRILIDSRPLSARLPRVIMNQQVQTTRGAQVGLVFDESNRIALAGDTTVVVREPRENVRQVLEVSKGEIWGRFTAAGQRFAVVFDRGLREISGTTTEFDLVCGERALALLPENFKAGQGTPTAVLRVFRGSLFVSSGDKTEKLVRGQWAVCDSQGGMQSGAQSGESFQLLRIDSSERFKDQLHWLNAEEYPLRAEHNVLELERQLRDLAQTLLAYRETNVLRNAGAEIAEFEKQVKSDIAAAKERIAQGKPRPESELPAWGPLRMTDEQLVAGETYILSAIAGWRQRAADWATLGQAASTLLSRVQSLNDQMAKIDELRTQALLRIQELEKLKESIKLQDAEIEALKKDEKYDPTGERRAKLDADIKAWREIAKKATEAKNKIELIRLKLAKLDDEIDKLKRARVPLQERLDKAKKSMEDIKAKQKANVYTEEKLSELRAKQIKAEEVDAHSDIALAGARDDAAKATTARENSEKKEVTAIKAVEDQKVVQTKANDALLDAVVKRDAAQKVLDDAEAEVTRLQGELAKIPEGERESSETKKQLDAAVKSRDEKKGNRDAAVKIADDAQTSLTKENVALKTLEEVLAKCRSAVEAAKLEEQKAQSKTKEWETASKDAEAALKTAKSAVSAMEMAKSEWFQLQKDHGAATVEYEKALWDVEDNDLAQKQKNDNAQPDRDTLAAQLLIIEESEKATAEIDKLKVERDRSQAIDDDLKRRLAARDSLQRDHDAIANSERVKELPKLDADFKALSIEHGALDYTRARGLEEERQLMLKQKQALSLYNAAAEESGKRAVTLLSGFCAPYRGFELGDTEAASQANFARVMEMLWKLYYSADGAEADGGGVSCYYVVARSGAPTESLRALDERWRAALAATLGKVRFEQAAALKAQDLAASRR